MRNVLALLVLLLSPAESAPLLLSTRRCGFLAKIIRTLSQLDHTTCRPVPSEDLVLFACTLHSSHQNGPWFRFCVDKKVLAVGGLWKHLSCVKNELDMHHRYQNVCTGSETHGKEYVVIECSVVVVPGWNSKWIFCCYTCWFVGYVALLVGVGSDSSYDVAFVPTLVQYIFIHLFLSSLNNVNFISARLGMTASPDTPVLEAK